MRYYKKITVLAALAVAAVGQMFAQNQSSPYSRYGYGLFSDYATSAQRNMGGVGVAMSDDTSGGIDHRKQLFPIIRAFHLPTIFYEFYSDRKDCNRRRT